MAISSLAVTPRTGARAGRRAAGGRVSPRSQDPMVVSVAPSLIWAVNGLSPFVRRYSASSAANTSFGICMSREYQFWHSHQGGSCQDWHSAMPRTFGPLLEEMIKTAGFPDVKSFAKRVSHSQPNMHRIVRGTRRPPLDQVEAWAEALRLTGDRRTAFVDEAHLDHASEHVRSLVACLQADAAQSRAQRRLATTSTPADEVHAAIQRTARRIEDATKPKAKDNPQDQEADIGRGTGHKRR